MRKAFLVALILNVLTGVAGATSCPSPSPTCATTGTVTISGSYSCTSVGLNANGDPIVRVSVLSFASSGDGVGTISLLDASNTNDPSSSPSYQDFASSTGTYCINADNTTGYLNPGSTGKNCPLAIAFTSANGVPDAQFRSIDSAENNVEALTCRAQ
jgi:hypothetical protein